MTPLTDGVPAGLVATFSLCWTGVVLPEAAVAEARLLPDLDAEMAMQAAYRCALQFAFNRSFSLRPWPDGPGRPKGTYRKGESRYLGHLFHTPSEELGSCRFDVMLFLLDAEDGIPTRLLQIHVKPQNGRIACSDKFICAMTEYSRHFTNDDILESVAQHTGSAQMRDPIFGLWGAALDCRRTGRERNLRGVRQQSLAHTYFLTFSLFGMEEECFENRGKHAVDLYRLLYSHAHGVERVNAEAAVGEGKGWRSTAFFEAWFQPGAMVVLSRGFPSDYSARREHFQASRLDVRPEDRTNMPILTIEDTRDAYDELPEYPALRYVTPLVAIYGLLYEEVLRDTYERLIALHREASYSFFSALFHTYSRNAEIGLLTRRLARINTLEHLRLPVSRPLGERMLQTKLQSSVTIAIDQLRTINTNTAAIAVIVSLLALTVSTVSMAVTVVKFMAGAS